MRYAICWTTTKEGPMLYGVCVCCACCEQEKLVSKPKPNSECGLCVHAQVIRCIDIISWICFLRHRRCRRCRRHTTTLRTGLTGTVSILFRCLVVEHRHRRNVVIAHSTAASNHNNFIKFEYDVLLGVFSSSLFGSSTEQWTHLCVFDAWIKKITTIESVVCVFACVLARAAGSHICVYCAEERILLYLIWDQLANSYDMCV